MPASFVLTKRLFETSGARDLYMDDTRRWMNGSAMAHGPRPNKHEHLSCRFLGVNFVLRGRGTYIDASGATYDLKPGTLFHRFPDTIHTTRFDPSSDYTEFFLCIDPNTGNQLRQLGLVPTRPVIHIGVEQIVVEEFSQLVKRMRLHEIQLPSRELLIEAISFLCGLYKREREMHALSFWDRIIRDGCLMLAHNQDDRERLEDIAESLGVTYAAFRKNFTLAKGMSPNEYRIRKRLEDSRQMLLTHTIKDIARMLGYCDSFAFSSQFKRHLGISPREYQRQARGS
jgi:AraC-like DNA-binding protein